MISSVQAQYIAGMGPYKFETVCIPVSLDELVDGPIDHPFRHHCKLVVTHYHSQQRQYVLMAKSFPGYYFLTEPLRSWSTHTLRRNSKPHLSDLDEVTRRAYLQYLYRNLEPSVFTLPYFTKPAPIPRSFRLIVAEWNLYRARDQSVMATYPAQCGEALPPEPRHHSIQRLLNVTGRFGFKSVDPPF